MLALAIGVGVCLSGCGGAATTGAKAVPLSKTKPAATKAGGVGKQPPQADGRDESSPAVEESPKQPPAQPTAPAAPPRKTLEDLAEKAAREQFRLPEIDEGKLAAAGIRKIAGKHLTLYTDLPAAPELDEYPRVFDLAVPQWVQFFNLEKIIADDWKLVGYWMKEKNTFIGAGLLPPELPPFPNGFQRGSEIWWYNQPGDYYARHLMLHEGTHAFMHRFLHGSGPPWYSEGMAELLGTHQWQAGKLVLGYNPRNRAETPYLGRVKLVQDAFAAERGMPLPQLLQLRDRSLQNEQYAWCWAACLFFEQHPLTHAAFRELKDDAHDISLDFSQRFQEKLKKSWPAINEDWELFVANLDYGYDVARAAVVRKLEIAPLPAAGMETKIAADRGWQSTGIRLSKGKTYLLTASGRYQVGKTSGEKGDTPWPCEAGGITLHYHRGRPLGMLLAAIGDQQPPLGPLTPLANPRAIGLAGEITPVADGVLYLCINESAAGLGDNAGELSVKVMLQE